MKIKNFIGKLVNLHKHIAKERWATVISQGYLTFYHEELPAIPKR